MTKKITITLIALFSCLSMASAAQWDQGWRDSDRRVREDRVVLDMYGAHYTGQSVIHLKQQLKQRGYSPANFELVRAVLVAKTKQGRGTAELVVGGSRSYPKTVMGSPRDFHNGAQYTYDKVQFRNPSYYDSQGVWQIHLKGNFKVQKIVLLVKRKFGRDRGDRWDDNGRGGPGRGRGPGRGGRR